MYLGVYVSVYVFVPQWGCVHVLYNDDVSVRLPAPDESEPMSFFNACWWLVFSDLLRPSLRLCLLSARLHPSPPLTADPAPPPRKNEPQLPRNKLVSNRSPSICVTPGIP